MANLRATIKDVACTAGVSTATVSRYLNDSGYVNDTTATRIQEAIRQTGYMPSLMARSLKTRHSQTLLLIVPDISNPFYARIAKILQQKARAEGYVLLLADSEGEADKELAALDMADQMSVEGVLFANINENHEANARLKVAGYCAVGLNAFGKGTPFDTVVIHSNGGTNLAVRELVRLGHRDIAFAGGTPGSFVANSRRHGYLLEMEAHRLPVRDDDMIEIGFGQSDGYEAGRRFLRRKPLPTAVCCANDLVALGVIRAINEAGLRVPEDISVTGMDDIPYAEMCNPPLTTVTNDGALFAEKAFAMLMARIGGDQSALRRVEIPNEVVLRASTGAPRKSS